MLRSHIHTLIRHPTWSVNHSVLHTIQYNTFNSFFAHLRTLNSLGKNQISKTQYAASDASSVIILLRRQGGDDDDDDGSKYDCCFSWPCNTRKDTRTQIYLCVPFGFYDIYFDIIGYIYSLLLSVCVVLFECGVWYYVMIELWIGIWEENPVHSCVIIVVLVGVIPCR